MQKIIWFAVPMLPLFGIFFIASIAETNRAPFDLAEALSIRISKWFYDRTCCGYICLFFLSRIC